MSDHEVDRSDFQPLINEVRAAASLCVSRFVQRGDHVAIVAFDMRPRVITDFTDNVGQLRQGVAQVARDHITFSESNLYDALTFVLAGGRDPEGTE